MRADDSLHLVSSLSAEHFGLWPYGLAIAALPLVSRPWTGLCWSHRLSLSSGGSVRGYTAPVGWLRGVLPYFLRSEAEFLRVLCFEFRAKSLRWGHPSGSSLSQSSIGTKTLPPPSWCMVRVFAMGSPCRVGVCPRSRSERRLFGAPSLVVGVKPSRWGHPFRVGWRFSAPSIGTKASSIHLSLVASRWEHPAGRVCGFPHSIGTKPALVSCLIFLQDGIPCRVWIFDLISNEGIATIGLLRAVRPCLGVALCHPLVVRSAL